MGKGGEPCEQVAGGKSVGAREGGLVEGGVALPSGTTRFGWVPARFVQSGLRREVTLVFFIRLQAVFLFLA